MTEVTAEIIQAAKRVAGICNRPTVAALMTKTTFDTCGWASITPIMTTVSAIKGTCAKNDSRRNFGKYSLYRAKARRYKVPNPSAFARIELAKANAVCGRALGSFSSACMTARATRFGNFLLKLRMGVGAFSL